MHRQMADMSEFRIGKGAEEAVTVAFVTNPEPSKTAYNKIWYLINKHKNQYLGLDIMQPKR